jgi:RNA polymerase sigma-70 factor (ECF subfamily)
MTGNCHSSGPKKKDQRRVHENATLADGDLARQRKVLDAFLGATRDGDLSGLLQVLAPDRRGDRAVAEETRPRPATIDRPVLALAGRPMVALELAGSR